MARERLQEVHEADLTESRINEEFVDWLKTKGPSWLLFILIGVAGYLGIIRWKQYKTQHVSEAWAAFAECRLPSSFEDVAIMYADIPGLPDQARRAAADALLQSVQTGQGLASDPTNVSTATPLTDDDRAANLNRAERLYREILDGDNESLAMTLHAVSALQGLAVVAESRGEADEARQWYETAAARADPYYPLQAQRIRERAATVDVYAEAIALPTESSLPEAPAPESRQPAVIDDSLRDLILADDAGT